MPRLDSPRVAPLAPAEWSEAQQEAMKPFVAQGRVFNVFATLLNHPDLFRRWLVFANHVLGKSTLALRDREILILRTAWLAQCDYEWRQHVGIARNAGMADDEIRAVRGSAAAGGSSPLAERERLLVRAADQLKRDTHLSDAVWQGLSVHYDTRQIMDIVFTVGQYQMLAMALNSLGVQLDEGLEDV